MMKPKRWFALAALALLPALAAAADFEVTMDATPLAGRSGYMALDLLVLLWAMDQGQVYGLPLRTTALAQPQRAQRAVAAWVA